MFLARSRSIQAWENKIERYVFNTAASLDADVLDERNIRKRFALGTGLCCDVAIIFSDAIVCIEVKTKNLSRDIPAAATVRGMRAKLKTTVLSADKQLLSVAMALQCHPQFGELPVYSLIATSADLLLGGAHELISPCWSEQGFKKPLVVSLDDIDWLIEGHRIAKFHMVSAQEDFQARLNDKPFALYSLQHLQAEEKYSISTPEHLISIFDNRLRRLETRTKLQLRLATGADENCPQPTPPHSPHSTENPPVRAPSQLLRLRCQTRTKSHAHHHHPARFVALLSILRRRRQR